MEVIPSSKVIEYFNNILDRSKADKLHSFCIARSMYFLFDIIREHGKQHLCFYFKCRFCRLLLTVLLSGKHYNLLKIVKENSIIIVKNKDSIKFV